MNKSEVHLKLERIEGLLLEAHHIIAKVNELTDRLLAELTPLTATEVLKRRAEAKEALKQ